MLRFINDCGHTVTTLTDVQRTVTTLERMRGLLMRPPLEKEQGLWITPCNSIHTFGMKYALDIAFLDKHQIIRKLSVHLSRRCFSGCWRAKSALELHAGGIESLKLCVGLRAEWCLHE